MLTTIEIAGSAIRLVREQRGRIVGLESFPVPPDKDPLEALPGVPLPANLGRVRVVLHHSDMLLRTMLQPPCPADRLDRIVRFELQGISREEAEPMSVAWHLVRAMGGGDMRILALLTKRRLVQQISQGLASHGARLGGLVHPGIALFHAWKRQEPAHQGDGIVVDVGGRHVHLALIQDGELLFVRTQGPGLDDLAKQVAELRGIAPADAAKLIAKIGKGAPDDLHELIRRQAQALATLLLNTVRFAKAQLHIERFDPTVAWIGGAGAQVHGFPAALAERLRAKVRILNPFAGTMVALPSEQLDPFAALPSPWTVALGAAGAEQLELDALQEDREKRLAFWRGEGALRVGAGLAAGLLALAVVRQTVAGSSAAATVARLGGGDAALVGQAERLHGELKRLRDDKALAEQRLRFLDGERRPGRIATELLAAIAQEQDPQDCPVVLTSVALRRKPGLIEVVVEGFAENAPGRSTADVLRAFEQRLVRRYQPIGAIEQQSRGAAADKQAFGYVIGIPDQPLTLLSRTSPDEGRHLTLAVAADPALGSIAVANALVARYRRTESQIDISIASGGTTTAYVWKPGSDVRPAGR